MINLFVASSGDKSLEYLKSIFGSMNGIIYDPSAVDQGTGAIISSSGGATISLLGTMFRTFNGVVLTIAILVVLYVTVVGIMMTAHEGEFMGKKWNNLWLPIRTVMGVALLVPTASGYCVLQLVMMWVIVQGIGAADRLWGTALAYIQVVGSPYGQVTIPSVGASQSMRGLFSALVCNASTAEGGGTNGPPTAIDKLYLCGRDSSYCQSNVPTIPSMSNNGQDTVTVPIGPGGRCGSFTICNSAVKCADVGSDTTKEVACLSCQAQATSLTTILGTFNSIAKTIVKGPQVWR